MLQELKSKPEPPQTTSGRYRWVVCGLLFFATTVNYMDRQILSLLKPILVVNYTGATSSSGE